MIWKNASVAGRSERRCGPKGRQEQIIQGFAGYGEGTDFILSVVRSHSGFKQERDMTGCMFYEIHFSCCEQRARKEAGPLLVGGAQLRGSDFLGEVVSVEVETSRWSRDFGDRPIRVGQLDVGHRRREESREIFCFL